MLYWTQELFNKDKTHKNIFLLEIYSKFPWFLNTLELVRPSNEYLQRVTLHTPVLFRLTEARGWERRSPFHRLPKTETDGNRSLGHSWVWAPIYFCHSLMVQALFLPPASLCEVFSHKLAASAHLLIFQWKVWGWPTEKFWVLHHSRHGRYSFLWSLLVSSTR